MSSIREVNYVLWRQRLRPASFKQAVFHVEQQGRVSGRRIVEHEYPKRDLPYGEDMGRHAMRYQITGYVIQAPQAGKVKDPNVSPFLDQSEDFNKLTYRGNMRDYDLARDALCEALDGNDQPGILIDPYNPRLTYLGYGSNNMLFFCERYTVTETRERGGVATFDMSFIEAGFPGNTILSESTSELVTSRAQAVMEAAVAKANSSLSTVAI